MTWTIPKTWNVGDDLTAADLNTYVRDNFTWIEGDTAPVTPTLAGGWVAWLSGFPSLYCVRRGYSVTMQGVVKNVTGGTLNSVFGPVAYLTPEMSPLWYQNIKVDLNGSYGRALVQSNGEIFVVSGSVVNNGYVDFGGSYSLI